MVVVGRSAQKTEAIAKEIGADFFVSDFADLGQVRTLAAQLKEKYPRIDVLANNAGGIMGPQAHRGRPRDNVPGQPPGPVPAHHRTDGRADRQPGHRHQHLERRERASASWTSTTSTRPEATPPTAPTATPSSPTSSSRPSCTTASAREGISTAAFHPGVRGHQLCGRVHEPHAARLQTFLKPLHADPGPGRGHPCCGSPTPPRAHDWISGAYYAKRALAKANKQAYDAGLARALWQRSEAMVAQDLDKLDHRQ